MVNNESELYKVVLLVQEIIDKIDRKIARSLKTEEELREAKAKIKRRTEILKAKYSHNKAPVDVNAEMDELEKKYAGNSSTFTMPTTAPVDAEVNSTNKNRA